MSKEIKCNFFEQCGGCDFLDLSDELYQKLKKESFKKELENHFNIDESKFEYVWVQGDRRKITLQIDKNNLVGFFNKKSHQLVEIDSCYVVNKAISDLILLLRNFAKKIDRNFIERIVITLFDSGLDLVFVVKKEPDSTQLKKFTNFALDNKINVSYQLNKFIKPIALNHHNQIFYQNFKIDLASDIFIQATKQGVKTISEVITQFLNQNKETRKIADLYAGFGSYSFLIADWKLSSNIANTLEIKAFEGSKSMIELIKKNSKNYNIEAVERDLFSNPLNAKEINKFDLVVINPPRNGALPQIKTFAESQIKSVIYVSCNPASFARDCKVLIANGFEFSKIVMLDQFYATKHCEVVAVLQKK